MNVAIIPARAGSKRIPNKNIKHFAGVPALSLAIRTAQESGLFTHIYVSTDSPEIAGIATKCGALIPFLREANLSDDYAGTVSVIGDFVLRMESEFKNVENICCIYPVTPLLKPIRLIEGYKQLVSRDLDYVFAAKSEESSLLRSFELGLDYQPIMVSVSHELTRSQDIKKLYHDAGQFYWGTKSAWAKHAPILSGKSSVVLLGKWEAIDVDTLEDWNIVEELLTLRSN